jgi:CBS domain-containing protein
VVDYILTSYQPDFAVVLGDRLLGVVTRQDVVHALRTRNDNPYVAEIMQREVVRVEADAGLDQVEGSMNEHQVRLVAVFAGPRYLGLVSREDLREALSVLLFEGRRLQPALEQG